MVMGSSEKRTGAMCRPSWVLVGMQPSGDGALHHLAQRRSGTVQREIPPCNAAGVRPGGCTGEVRVTWAGNETGRPVVGGGWRRRWSATLLFCQRMVGSRHQPGVTNLASDRRQ